MHLVCKMLCKKCVTLSSTLGKFTKPPTNANAHKLVEQENMQPVRPNTDSE